MPGSGEDANLSPGIIVPVHGEAGWEGAEYLDNHACGEDTQMADPPRYPGTGDDTDNEAGPDRESPPGVPRWVKVLGIIAAVLVLLTVIVLVVGGGGHGPGRHALDQNQEQRIGPGDGGARDPSTWGHG
jgi:hypothetical protein